MKSFLIIILLTIYSSSVSSQGGTEFYAVEFDSLTIKRPVEGAYAQFYSDHYYYFRYITEQDIKEAVVITTWKDSTAILEQAYIGPYKCVGTSFVCDSVTLSLALSWSKFNVDELYLAGPLLDTPVKMNFYSNNRISGISYGKFLGNYLEFAYNSDGNLLLTSEIKNGMKNGMTKSYYPSGALSSTTNYIDGKAEGFSFQFYEDGSIFMQMQYVNGELNGYLTQYDETGQVTRRERYLNGVKME